jgi:hypothetical protein
MNDETIKKTIEDSYDESKEEGLRSIVRDFYTRKLMSSVILVWTLAILFIGLAVYGAVQFFKTDQIRLQILFAALFLWGMHEFGVIRIFVWQMAHRRNLKREIKRLELRVAELAETLKGK